jgi:hypothetical protein
VALTRSCCRGRPCSRSDRTEEVRRRASVTTSILEPRGPRAGPRRVPLSAFCG